MDVLPLYIVLMLFFPPVLWLLRKKAGLALGVSVLLYAVTWELELALPSYPSGTWFFNPFAWQLLFVFGAWCALGGVERMARILSSRITIGLCIAYLVFCLGIVATWHFPSIDFLVPKSLATWMYPISKPDLDVLRFAHFLALAAVTVYFLKRDWPGLKSVWLQPLILCGTHSLEIFCIGIFLAFAGHFIMAEFSGGAWTHFVISVVGIVIMTVFAWVFSWYKAASGAKGAGASA
jgi:hypothetical protein